MKRGTASRVILGKNTIAEMPGGVFVGTDVILGKKDGLTNDFNGLVLSNTVMLGKKVSHAAIISVIVRGADRIVLPDAIANSLQYVKAFGGTEQNGTPTPDAPVDIVSNNGVLRASTQLFVNGNLANGTTNWSIETLTYTDTADYAQFYNANGSFIYLRCIPPTRIAGHKYAYLLKAKNSGGTTPWGTRNGVQLGFLTTTETMMAGIDTFPSGGSGNPWLNIPANTTIYVNKSSGFRLYDLTALGLDNTITTAEQAIAYFGDAYTEPGEVYTDGTVETINVHTRNLFNGVFNDGWGISSANGEITSSAGRKSFYIPVKAGQKYTISRSAVGESSYWYYGTYNNEPYTAGQACVSFNNMGASATRYTITIPNGANYLVIFFGTGTSPNVQAEQGSTATEYTPYFNGGTATAEMLLKVGNYQDEQEILSGAVTRNIRILVLTGDESWTRQNPPSGATYYTYNLSIANYSGAGNLPNVPYCTHLRRATATSRSSIPDNCIGVSQNTPYNTLWLRCDTYESTTDWTNFLKAQYNAGTPVIVVYPLATPTTESVAGQTLQVTDGDNVLEITQASLTGLELEAQYNTQVQLTVQEVESANLDNDVTVTIL